jgi:hypothetical protein
MLGSLFACYGWACGGPKHDYASGRDDCAHRRPALRHRGRWVLRPSAELAAVGPTPENTVSPFRTTGRTFLMSYELRSFFAPFPPEV